ncbi:PIN domain-containing protein [Variovorax sp. VNK109]|jgi:predicted nucleic acid-binding protein|uniref:PIN domain-containing protein n=1 Tax=Variovorax sp. VNK109 TaxID=3400919 RepID=UPI003C122272
MRIFLDANVLFSAARSDGAIRELLRLLIEGNHQLMADTYVTTEAARNIAAKAPHAVGDLDQLLTIVSVQGLLRRPADAESGLLEWLHEKDRPVLLAAMALHCNVLVTGDKTHFGPGYGRTFGGVTIHSPAMLAEALLT